VELSLQISTLDYTHLAHFSGDRAGNRMYLAGWLPGSESRPELDGGASLAN